MDRKNRAILVIFDDLFTGGAFTLNRAVLSAAQSSLKADIIVLTGISPGQTLDTEWFPYAKKIITYSIPDIGHPRRFFYIAYRTIQLIRSIRKEYLLGGVIGNIVYSAFAANLYCSALRIPYAYFYHGALYLEKKSYVQGKINLLRKIKHSFVHWLHWLLQYILIQRSTVGCFSTFARRQLNGLFHKHKVNLLSVPFMYHETTADEKRAARKQLGIDPHRFLLVVPSRIEPRKGQDILLQALSIIPADIKIAIVFCGPVHPNAVYYFSDLLRVSLPGNIHTFFMGERAPNDMWSLYKAADATIMPSVKLETLGMVTLESLSVGTPVIAFPTGGSQEILRRFAGLLAKQPDYKGLATAIQQFLRLPPGQKTLLKKKIMNYIQQTHGSLTAITQLKKFIREAGVTA